MTPSEAILCRGERGDGTAQWWRHVVDGDSGPSWEEGVPVDPTCRCAENIEQELLEPLRVTVLEGVLFRYNFISFWLPWVFFAACRLSLLVASRACALVGWLGFPLWWLLLLWSAGL